ncbi:MAG: endonuclease [Deltaproteobacteria bacterium]|nr:endonuclease [Deltaproteobacteria bacterium]
MSDARAGDSEAWFAPHMDVCGRIIHAFRSARARVDVCVFTVTDDRITRAILDAHRRGVKIRVVSDDDKSGDLGSDIERLAEAGVSVRIDRTPVHMHHKFAIFDGDMLMTGSYNWTRSANDENHENLLVTFDPALVAAYTKELERVWSQAMPV